MAEFFTNNPSRNVGSLTTSSPVTAGSVPVLKYHNGSEWVGYPLKKYIDTAWVAKQLKNVS